MADLVKGVLGRGWPLLVGWILPTFLSLQLIAALVLPAFVHVTAVDQFLRRSVATRQVSLLAIAAVAGVVLAAVRTMLYRVLEGYTLWPLKVAEYRIEHHRARRARLVAKQDEIASSAL